MVIEIDPASVGRRPLPDRTAAVSGVGATIAAAAEQITRVAGEQAEEIQEADDRATLRRVRTDAIRQVGELRIAAEQDTDFASLPDRFTADLDRVKAEISDTLPVRLQSDFALTFDEAAVSHRLDVTERAGRRWRDDHRARLGRDLGAASDDILTAGDPTTQGALADQAIDAILDAEMRGLISPEEAEAARREFTRNTAEALVIRGIRDDPVTTLRRLEAGEWTFDATARARFINQAESQIERVRARAAREAEAVAAAERRDLGRRVDTARRLIMGGQEVEDLAALQSDVAGTDFEIELNATVEASTRFGDFASMTVREQAEAMRGLAAISSTDPNAAFEMSVRQDLTRMHIETVEALVNDPLGHIQSIQGAELAPMDLDSLADPEAAQTRAVHAAALADQWGTRIRYFTNDELAGFKEQLAGMNADDRVALAGSLRIAFGDQAGAVMAELGTDDPMFAHAGRLVAAGNLDAATLMMRGREALAGPDAIRPTRDIERNVQFELMAEAFPPGDTRSMQQLGEAARQHFAVTAATIDPEDEDELRAAFARSLQAVAGQRVAHGEVLGGFQEVNGRMALLPTTVNGAEVERRLSSATLETLAAAGLGGGEPGGISGPFVPSDPILIHQGGGIYILARDGEAGPEALIDQDTRDPFRLDLRAFLAAEPPRNSGPEVEIYLRGLRTLERLIDDGGRLLSEPGAVSPGRGASR